MEDFRDAKSTDFLYEDENVFLRLHVVLTKSSLKWYELITSKLKDGLYECHVLCE